MEMHQVRYFLAVARELNFTRAAEACNVTQPSLTRAIQKLEEELGGQLFRRERALTHLSELGRLMLPHLERTYEAAQAARALARSIGKTEVAPLVLGVADDIFTGRLADLLGDLATALPGLEVRLSGGASSSLIALALEGTLDLLIVERPDPVPDRMDVWSLFEEDMQLLGPADAPDELALAALADVPWIAGDSAADRALQRLVQDQGLAVRHRATGAVQVAQLVAARLGYGLVPAGLPLAAGQRRCRITDFACERDVVLATVAGRQRTVAAEAFQKAARTVPWANAD